MNQIKYLKDLLGFTNQELADLFEDIGEPIILSTIANRVRSKSGRDTLGSEHIMALSKALLDDTPESVKKYKVIRQRVNHMQAFINQLTTVDATDELIDDDEIIEESLDDDEFDFLNDEVEEEETLFATDDDEIDSLFGDMLAEQPKEESNDEDFFDDLFDGVDATPSTGNNLADGQTSPFSEGGDFPDDFDLDNAKI